ncbi:hypothetical protein D3C79_947430 [compost metagenome]
MGVVITHADVTLGDPVLGGVAPELGQRLDLGHGGADAEGAGAADGGGHRLIDEIVQALGADFRQQGTQLFLTRAYVAADEIGFLFEFKQ